MSQTNGRQRRRSASADLPPPVEGLVWGARRRPRKRQWYLPGSIPGGSIVLLEGRKGTGKSSMAAAFAAAAAGGPTVPGWSGPTDATVIWCAGEDSWDYAVLPRLLAAGVPTGRVAQFLPRDKGKLPRRPVLPGDLDLLASAISQSKTRLLILDPYSSLAHPDIDLRIPQQARQYLEPLSSLLAETDCVGVLIRHLRKGTGGDAREQGLGCVEISNVARSIMRCDEHPHERGRYVLSTVASNYGLRRATQVYHFDSGLYDCPVVRWIGESTLDADSIAEGRGNEAERDEWSEADRLLAAVIGDGWAKVADLESEAESAGVSSRTLRRAKARLSIPSRRTVTGTDAYWEWGPPPGGFPVGLVESAPPT